ncbi:hypothetical protein PV326_003698 [Microctonus aethiopoides]|nr:hypothetical protein PV326_003698 [Microctonus aethiopoides]
MCEDIQSCNVRRIDLSTATTTDLQEATTGSRTLIWNWCARPAVSRRREHRPGAARAGLVADISNYARMSAPTMSSPVRELNFASSSAQIKPRPVSQFSQDVIEPPPSKMIGYNSATTKIKKHK